MNSTKYSKSGVKGIDRKQLRLWEQGILNMTSSPEDKRKIKEIKKMTTILTLSDPQKKIGKILLI